MYGVSTYCGITDMSTDMSHNIKHYLTKETLPVNYEVNDKIIKDIRYC